MYTLCLRHRLCLPHPTCLSLHPTRSPGVPAHTSITNLLQSEWAWLAYKFKLSAKQIHFAWNRLGSTHKSSSTDRLEVNNLLEQSSSGAQGRQHAATTCSWPSWTRTQCPLWPSHIHLGKWQELTSDSCSVLFHNFLMLIRPNKCQSRISIIVLESSWHLQPTKL